MVSLVRVATFLVALLSSFGSPMSTAQQQPPTVNRQGSSALAGQGIYTAICVTDVAHLDYLRQRGIQIVMNYSQFDCNPTIQQEINFVQHAASIGMQVLWGFNDGGFSDPSQGFAGMQGTNLLQKFPAMTASLRQLHPIATNHDFIDTFVRAVANEPGTFGYYLADEPVGGRYSSVSALSNLVHQDDSRHPRVIVEGSSGPWLNGLVTAYAGLSDIILQDYYPIGLGMPINGVATIAQQLQHVKAQWGMALQAHSLAEYSNLYTSCQGSIARCPFPTAAQMVQMRNDVLNYGNPSLILWYSDFDAANPSFNPPGNPNQQWNALTAAITNPTYAINPSPPVAATPVSAPPVAATPIPVANDTSAPSTQTSPALPNSIKQLNGDGPIWRGHYAPSGSSTPQALATNSKSLTLTALPGFDAMRQTKSSGQPLVKNQKQAAISLIHTQVDMGNSLFEILAIGGIALGFMLMTYFGFARKKVLHAFKSTEPSISPRNEWRKGSMNPRSSKKYN